MFSPQIYRETFVNHRCTGGFTYFVLHLIHATFCIEPRRFENMAGGYEVRNPYYKGCIIGKDITIVKHRQEQRQSHICVFEGFMDFLSYLTLKRREDSEVCINFPADYLIMNSVSNLKKTLVYLGDYPTIHCYLDNDLAGKKTVETIAGMYEARVVDESLRYSEYKDLNDYIREKRR